MKLMNRTRNDRYGWIGIVMRACKDPVGERGNGGHMQDFDLRVLVVW